MCKNYNEKELKIFNSHAASPFCLDWDSDGNYFEIRSLYYQGTKYRIFNQEADKWVSDLLDYVYSKSEMFSDIEMCHDHIKWRPKKYKPFIEFGHLDQHNSWHKVYVSTKDDKLTGEIPTHIGIFLNKDAEFINKNFKIKPEFIYRFKSIKARGWEDYTFSVFKLPEEFIPTGMK